MAETQTNQTNGGLPPQIFRQLRQVEREFKDEVLPLLRAKRHFVSRGEKRREKTRRPSCQKPAIRFSPFAMTLDNSLLGVQSPIRKNRPVQVTTLSNPAGQLVSVFVIAVIAANPPVYVLQKVQKKSAPGFPGGGIEERETILRAAAREWEEEGSGKDPAGKNTDITPYNPCCIGTFVLDRAVNGEQGAVVLVEIPESEIGNLRAGGGAEEGEVIEKIFFLRFEEVSEKVESRAILPNSVKIWDLYCDFLVNAP